MVEENIPKPGTLREAHLEIHRLWLRAEMAEHEARSARLAEADQREQVKRLQKSLRGWWKIADEREERCGRLQARVKAMAAEVKRLRLAVPEESHAD